MKSKEFGITLVALVITIISLLILAGVTLNLTLGENGLLERTLFAKNKYENSQKQEENDLEKLYSSINIATNEDAQITINMKDLNALIEQKVKEYHNTSNVAPTGSIISQMGKSAPNGYLKCDGAIYNINDYKNLADYINSEFGSYNYFGGDGSNTFAVPNLQGEFLRGTGTNAHESNGKGSDVGRHQDATVVTNICTTGQEYNNMLQIRKPTKYSSASRYDSVIESSNVWVNYYKDEQGTDSTYVPTLITTRPTNTSVLYCIKY